MYNKLTVRGIIGDFKQLVCLRISLKTTRYQEQEERERED